MRTEIIRLLNSPSTTDNELYKQAGDVIKEGGLVAFPTETVYGLGGDALNPQASMKIYEAKGRPSDNPLIVHIADFSAIDYIAADIPPAAAVLSDSFWPGPLTMIFNKKATVPYETTGGLDTVAVRMPDNEIALSFIRAAGGYIAAPSANLSGRPSPTTAEHVYDDLNGRIPLILDGGSCNIGLESTIIDLTSDIPMILRPGFISKEMLESVIGKVMVDPALSGPISKDVRPKAPGMKYRHYAPKGQLSIVSGSSENVSAYIKSQIELNKSLGKRVGVISSSENINLYANADFLGNAGNIDDEISISSNLYQLLRKCDEENIDIIYSEEFDTPQLGMAIMNRLMKAAGHTIIKV